MTEVKPNIHTTKMPFGKYKGISVIDVVERDIQYAWWLTESFSDGIWKDVFNEALRQHSIAEALELDYPEGHLGGW